jgi:etoposide-induced 2.4 mRNA
MFSRLSPYFDLFCRGLHDAVRNAFHVLTIDDDFSRTSSEKNSTKQHPHQPKPKKSSSSSDTKRVKSNLALLCLFNGGILLCGMLCFNYIFLPIFRRLFYFLAGLDSSSSSSSSRPLLYIQHMLTYTFNFLWLIPAFIISKFVNSYWFRDIANAVFKKLTNNNRPLPALPLARSISDVLFSLIMQIFFLIQSTIILLIPVPFLNKLFGNMCLCLLYSFYAFEYAWIYGNLNVKQRVERIELYWPYFLGFGLPLTALSSFIFNSMIVNECIFSILFPFAIVAATSVNFNERIRLPQTQTNIVPLNIFAGCIRLTSRLFDMLKYQRPSNIVTTTQ